jgi:ribosomal protein S12 methylthiotransferase accessory factor
MRKFLDVPSFDAETFNEDVTWELDRLRSAGIGNILFVDLTRAELGMPVVRIVIPGLEPKRSIADYLPGPRAQVILERHA